jgi:hypothetical protein
LRLLEARALRRELLRNALMLYRAKVRRRRGTDWMARVEAFYGPRDRARSTAPPPQVQFAHRLSPNP